MCWSRINVYRHLDWINIILSLQASELECASPCRGLIYSAKAPPPPGTKGSKQKKWNESGFRPPLCTYRLNWARRTSWGWWDDWDDTVLQTQDSKYEPWRSEAEHATSRSRRLPTILTFTRGWGRNIFVSFKPPRPGTEPRTLAWKAAVLTTTLGPPPIKTEKLERHRQMKWTEWGVRPPLCTYKLNWTSRTSSGCKTLYNGRGPITQVFKWSRKSPLRHLWWFQMVYKYVRISGLSGLTL